VADVRHRDWTSGAGLRRHRPRRRAEVALDGGTDEIAQLTLGHGDNLQLTTNN
jgi:hypothetical protein